MNHLVHTDKQTTMFSQYGKHTTEVIKQSLIRNQYFNDMTDKLIRKKSLKPVYEIYYDFKNIKEDELNPPPSLIPQQSQSVVNQNFQPFNKITSRNLSNKPNDNSNTGLYQPKYHLVFKKDALYEDKDYINEITKKQIQLKLKHQINDFRSTHHTNEQKSVIQQQDKKLNENPIRSPQRILEQSPNISQIYQDANSNKLDELNYQTQSKQSANQTVIDCKNVLNFSKQIGRQYVKSDQDEVDSFLLPEIKTKVSNSIKYSQKILFGYFSPSKKDSGQLFKSNISGLVYDIDYSQVEGRKDIKIPTFSKVQPRKAYYCKPVYTWDEPVNNLSIEQFAKLTTKNTIVPDFKKMTSRITQKKPTRTLLLSQSLDYLNYKSMFAKKSEQV